MKPSDGHSRRICKILKSEWWRQVRTFKDLLRIACANGMDGHPGYRQYRQWCNVADSTSEFLWRTVRPTLPVQKKGNPVQGHVLNLSTTPIPEEHERVLGLGPKYCFEPHLNPFEKIATATAGAGFLAVPFWVLSLESSGPGHSLSGVVEKGSQILKPRARYRALVFPSPSQDTCSCCRS
ncbi:hypothetical protein HPB50_028194 [Hyalomma asiaticum]|nr:hypothetical protein HPB50_028194 [Hyalomma asiaticum]